MAQPTSARQPGEPALEQEAERAAARRFFRFTDDVLQPLAFGTLVLVVAIQFGVRPLIFPGLATAILVTVSALTLGSLVPSRRLPQPWRTAFVTVLMISSALLLPLAETTAAPVFAFVAAGIAGEKMPSRRSALVVACAGAATAAGSLWLAGHLDTGGGHWLWWLGFSVATPVWIGIARRDRQDATDNAEKAAEAVESVAALRKRTRIAHDVNDVLCHSLAGAAIQLDMADALHGARRDDEANLAVRQARKMVVDGMSETRRAIEALTEDVLPLERALGLLAKERAVRLEVLGEPGPVSPAAARVVLRTAEETLPHLREGAPRSATLAFTSESVIFEVRNDVVAAGIADGTGFAGIRERVALVGGTLRAEPGAPAPGGWMIKLEVPR